MSKVAVIYWSGTGNTEAMAKKVQEGAAAAGAEAMLTAAGSFDPSTISQYDGIAFGCPAMGAEELEDSEFSPMFESCTSALGGKKLSLFGSYGWGDGEWMRTWEANCKKIGAVLVTDSVICCGEPDADTKEACKALGKALS